MYFLIVLRKIYTKYKTFYGLSQTVMMFYTNNNYAFMAHLNLVDLARGFANISSADGLIISGATSL